MNESDRDPVAVLIAVSNAKFGQALIQVLRSCAPFPVKAAVTSSIDHAVAHLREEHVDILLMDATFPSFADLISVTMVREYSDVPTILFTDLLTRDAEARMLRLGAQAVLPRESIDPITLLETIMDVLKSRSLRKQPSPLPKPRAIMIDEVTVEDLDPTCDDIRLRLIGVNRLRQFLMEGGVPSGAERDRLRKLLSRFKGPRDQV